MTTTEFYQEMEDQLMEETASGVSNTNYQFDDSSWWCVEVDYTTQS